MQSLYVNTTTSGSNPSTVINASGPVVIRKILIGNPVTSGNITIFTEGNALANNTTQIGYKKTFPASFTSIQPETQIDFRASSSQGGSVESDGLFCQTGACITIDQQMQVTVLWDVAEG
jgi:hypothetical protein